MRNKCRATVERQEGPSSRERHILYTKAPLVKAIFEEGHLTADLSPCNQGRRCDVKTSLFNFPLSQLRRRGAMKQGEKARIRYWDVLYYDVTLFCEATYKREIRKLHNFCGHRID